MNKQLINKTYYQLNKDKIKAQRQARYQKQKQPTKPHTDYYQAHNIQVLLSLKEYTQLSKQKHKL
jgi:hypothetical protein